MKVIALIRTGNSKSAFEIKEVEKPQAGNGEVLIKIAAFGLNFADVMALKKGIRALAAGGRMVCYGAAGMTDKNIFQKLKAALDFGFYHPLMLLSPSKSIIGVNMLRIADNKPGIIKSCLESVIQLTDQGVFKPTLAKVFNAKDIGIAHDYLEKRKSIGKVVMVWS